MKFYLVVNGITTLESINWTANTDSHNIELWGCHGWGVNKNRIPNWPGFSFSIIGNNSNNLLKIFLEKGQQISIKTSKLIDPWDLPKRNPSSLGGSGGGISEVFAV